MIRGDEHAVAQQAELPVGVAGRGDELPAVDVLAGLHEDRIPLVADERPIHGALADELRRDGVGRTYVATTVSLPSLQLAALEAAVDAAVSSGAEGLEAAAVVTAGSGSERSGGVLVDGIGAVRDLASGARAVPVLVADLDGRVRALLT